MSKPAPPLTSLAAPLSSASRTNPDHFWADSPSVLVDANHANHWIPGTAFGRNANLNALVRLSVAIALVLKLCGVSWRVFWLPLGVVAATYVQRRNPRDAAAPDTANMATTTDVGKWINKGADRLVDAAKALKRAVAKPATRTSKNNEAEEGFALWNDAADKHVSVANTGAPSRPPPAAVRAYNYEGSAPVTHGQGLGCKKLKQKWRGSRWSRQGRALRSDADGECVVPADSNPFANPLPGDALRMEGSCPRSCTHPDNPSQRLTREKAFYTNGVYDERDVFNRNGSQRQFYSVPCYSGIDKNWLYDIGPTRKETGLIRAKANFW